MSINTNDTFRPKGNVKIKIIDKSTNEVIEELENHNLIVKKGRSELIKILTGQSTKKITKIAIGSGGAPSSTPFAPTPPTDNDAGLATAVKLQNINNTQIDLNATNPKMIFTAIFDSAYVNSLVNECGLFFDDGATMFARHTFKTVPLDDSSNFTLEITWTIEF